MSCHFSWHFVELCCIRSRTHGKQPCIPRNCPKCHNLHSIVAFLFKECFVSSDSSEPGASFSKKPHRTQYDFKK